LIDLTLFPEVAREPEIRTDGIKYAGSKRKLIPYILGLVGECHAKSVFDGFSGSTRVSQALAASGYEVRSNDLAPWSRVFATCYLMCPHPRAYYKDLIDHLNSLPGKDGWFTANYGGEPLDGNATSSEALPKRPWQKHNTRRLDAIREEIDHLNLCEVDKCVAISSLILALDKVDSTLGHFASYLRDWSARSYKAMRLEVPSFSPQALSHTIYENDIFDLLDTVEADVAYLDPPYGSNNDKMPPSRIRYQAYYHVWKSICLFDKPPLFGKVRRRLDSSDTVAASVFEEFRKNLDGRFIAMGAIEHMLRRVKSSRIVLSYSSGGRGTAEELNDVIRRIGKLIKVVEIDHKEHVMAGMRWTNEWIKDCASPNREFLFLIEK
jgi:adenine-specific DNA-methyltransferase